MKQLHFDAPLYDYLLKISLREHPVLRELREETARMELRVMQIPPEQAQFMQMLLRLTNATQVLELGTFTGYSALAMALALPDHGRVITCDINKTWTAKTDYFWQKAQQDHKIELRLGPALETMQSLVDAGKTHTFDFIFIDADKTNYVHYYELALKLIRPSGLIAVDNVFWNGDVIDATVTNAQTREIRRLNTLIQQDERVDVSLLAIADGLFLIQPKHSFEVTS
jgi:predicted O-methyltransferase YrrM